MQFFPFSQDFHRFCESTNLKPLTDLFISHFPMCFPDTKSCQSLQLETLSKSVDVDEEEISTGTKKGAVRAADTNRWALSTINGELESHITDYVVRVASKGLATACRRGMGQHVSCPSYFSQFGCIHGQECQLSHKMWVRDNLSFAYTLEFHGFCQAEGFYELTGLIDR